MATYATFIDAEVKKENLFIEGLHKADILNFIIRMYINLYVDMCTL